ncbi:MAG: transglutaminase N-terminal domain-containing protein [Betaproteobacteria bacterium]
MTQISIEHDSHYQYQTEVELAHHLAYLRPMEFNGQKVVSSKLDITPTPDRLTENTDTFGNRRTFFTLSIPHDTLIVRATSVVTLVDRYVKFNIQDASEWEDVRDALAYALNRPYVAQCEFTFPSPYVPRLGLLRDYAMPSFPRGRGLAQACIDLSARIHRDFTYSPAATEVNTPLLEAFEKRAGVCQDFSHILIGCLRSIGLSAKYVSGYLLTKPAPGQEKLRGADASHAWVAVYCPEAPDGWLELDPTNNVIPQLGHVRLAMGRDFGDVSPLRGVIRGGDEHVLKVGVTVEQV